MPSPDSRYGTSCCLCTAFHRGSRQQLCLFHLSFPYQRTRPGNAYRARCIRNLRIQYMGIRKGHIPCSSLPPDQLLPSVCLRMAWTASCLPPSQPEYTACAFVIRASVTGNTHLRRCHDERVCHRDNRRASLLLPIACQQTAGQIRTCRCRKTEPDTLSEPRDSR